jgi:hypothetical protein
VELHARVDAEFRDLSFLDGELAAVLDTAFTGGLPGSEQFASGALGEPSAPMLTNIW